MMKAAVARTPILAFILMFFALGYTIAHNKVVVVPLGADAGVSGYEIVSNGFTSTINVNGGQNISAICPSDKKVIGGGARSTNGSFLLSRSDPTLTGTGWIVRAANKGTTSGTNTLTAYAICANIIN